MKHYLGIDYGRKRIGLAYADSLGIAFPLHTLSYENSRELWDGLGAVLHQKKIQHCIIGLPLNSDGTEGPRAQEIKAFAEILKKRFALEVDFSDEYLTTQSVKETKPRPKSLQAHKKARKQGLVDQQAAALILQDYLNELGMTNLNAPLEANPQEPLY